MATRTAVYQYSAKSQPRSRPMETIAPSILRVIWIQQPQQGDRQSKAKDKKNQAPTTQSNYAKGHMLRKINLSGMRGSHSIQHLATEPWQREKSQSWQCIDQTKIQASVIVKSTMMTHRDQWANTSTNLSEGSGQVSTPIAQGSNKNIVKKLDLQQATHWALTARKTIPALQYWLDIRNTSTQHP